MNHPSAPLVLAVLALALAQCEPKGNRELEEQKQELESGRLVLPPPRVEVPPPRPSELGHDFEDADFRVHVAPARPCTPQAPFLPPPGRRRVAVDVTVAAKTERLVPVGPLTFWLEDDQGRRHGATLAGCGGSFANQNLVKAQSVRGEISFDIPEDAPALRLVYEPFLIGRPQVTAALALPTNP